MMLELEFIKPLLLLDTNHHLKVMLFLYPSRKELVTERVKVMACMDFTKL